MAGESRWLIYDLESAPLSGYAWKRWDTDLIKITQDWFLLTVSWMWLGEKKIHVMGLDDFPGYVPGSTDDRALVEVIHKLFDECDGAITHNGNSFDQPKARTRMLIHGMPPPRPFLEIDTLKEARKTFAFSSNSLESLCAQLGLGVKGKPGFAVWEGCLNGEAAAWRSMKSYCKNDVQLLYDLFITMRPYMERFPNMALIAGDRPDTCPRCGTTGQLIVRGYRYAQVTKRIRYQCKKCKGYCAGRAIEKSQVTHVT